MAKRNLNFSLSLLVLFLVILLAGCAGSSDNDSSGSDNPTSTPTPSGYKLSDTGQTNSYTNAYGEDSDYFINPPSFTDNGDGTVTDNNTGLIWQQAGRNGCNNNGECSWSEAKTHCNSLQLSGGGWRLPEYQELVSIVDYGRESPAINTDYFHDTLSNYWYWSSTVNVRDTDYAWCVWASPVVM